jgi:gentisate 1,2-dioxygenase
MRGAFFCQIWFPSRLVAGLVRARLTTRERHIVKENKSTSRCDVSTGSNADVPAENLAQFVRCLPDENLAPLWEVMRELAPREPLALADPVLWSFGEVSGHLHTAGCLIGAGDAERRVLILENPSLKGRSQVTTSLYAGLQIVMPGEVARSHRHTAAAVRLIFESQGGHTTVNGEKILMRPGDFIITPSMAYHNHGNDGDEPVIWLDVLDAPIVNLLGAGFGNNDDADEQRRTRSIGDTQARFGAGMMPAGYSFSGPGTPIFHYPYDRTRAALEKLRRLEEWDRALGLKMAFSDPTTASPPTKTMGGYIQLFPAGFSGVDYRATDGAVFTVIEGHGVVRFGDKRWLIGPKDTFVVPGWAWHAIDADEDLILFSVSDRPLQAHLGFWREQRRES